MSSKHEQVIAAIEAALKTVPNAGVERNATMPVDAEDISAGAGLIILRDGDAGEPEVTLGVPVYSWRREMEIELFVRGAQASARDAALDALMLAVGAALDSDPSLGGLVDGLDYTPAEPEDERVPGAEAIKMAVIDLAVEYDTTTVMG